MSGSTLHHVRVYRFVFRDPSTGSERISDDYATVKAIEQMGAEPIDQLSVPVELSRVGPAGLLIAEVPRSD